MFLKFSLLIPIEQQYRQNKVRRYGRKIKVSINKSNFEKYKNVSSLDKNTTLIITIFRLKRNLFNLITVSSDVYIY